MIRFACPGCSATYSVDDAKGGKAGKCPKCGAQFLIPTAVDAAGFAPPPPPPPPPARREFDPTATTAFPPPPLRPPPPPPATPREVEIKPCPKCGARLSVAPADLGSAVECPYCQAVYTAKKPGATEPERPSRRPTEPSRRRDEGDDDRPRSRPRRDEEDEDDRPRRRREEDEEEEDRPRRRKRRPRRSEAVDTVTRLNYVLGGLSVLCGCVAIGAGGLAGAAGKAAQQQGKQMPIDPGTLSVVLVIMGIVYLLLSFTLIVAGVGLSKRQSWGRVLTIITGVVGVLLCLASIGGAVANVVGGQAAQGVGGLVAAGIWGGYGFTALRTMFAHADEFE